MKRELEDASAERQSSNPSGEPGEVTASSSYALFQLARALTQSSVHADPAVAERSRKKAATWQQVFSGMVSGALQIGSRTPVKDVPAWATLEVVAGGFATGALLAGGPLRPHELAIIERLQLQQAVAARPGAERSVLNAYFCSDAGLAELRARLHDGCYRLEVPEEGALLVACWLVEKGELEKAQEILEKLAPFFSQLRFYPLSHPHPYTPSSVVHVETVAQTIEQLAAMKERRETQPQREAHLVWNPYLDRLVALFVETIEGELPRLELGEAGHPLRSPDGKWHLSGGWPCQKYPAGWSDRARLLLADFKRLRAQSHSSKKPERQKENLAQLRTYLERCVADPRSLSGREVGMVRLILAHIIAARGLPDSPRCQVLRREQAAQASRPTKKELSAVLLARLSARPKDGGIDAIEPLIEPSSAEEATRFNMPAGAKVALLQKRLLRCLNAPVKFLVDKGVITASEVLARVLPQLTAQVGAQGFADADLRRLYGALYEAFRKRRSLLLLNLERQVRLPDLPWVAALASFRIEDRDYQARARAVLIELVTLALTAFPQAILPNKLLQEIRALCERAGLKLPIVDEIAADIFMGEFTEKFVEAAKGAAQLLNGTLYETYYGISYERVRRIRDVEPAYERAAPTSKTFLRMCAELAGQAPDARHRSVAANGCLLEQELILTTHNLAVLTDALALRAGLAPQLGELVRRTFTWICTTLQHDIKNWRARLHAIKNSAYAFRQMIFCKSSRHRS